jgi:CO/xanthine dehydrogenase Mo-binding subunit
MARELGIDPLELRRLNLLKQGDRTSTGGTFRDRIILPEMTDRILDMSQYCRKKESFALERKRGVLKGIGISLFFHGGGFTGSGERDMIKAAVKLVKYPDGMVEILIANVEMGQGAQTSMRKIAAHALGIALEKVIYQNPDTDRVPDSGPTVAYGLPL